MQLKLKKNGGILEMEKFKFRAWHKKERRMFEVAGISWWDSLIYESFDDISHDMDDCILLLYTGHFDKNKKKSAKPTLSI